MKRRTYLASLAALTTSSGCISHVRSRHTSTEMAKTVTVSNVERRPPAEPERLDEDEKPTGLEIAVEVVDGEITASTTARVTLTYTNGGADTLEMNINPESPDPLASEAEDPGLVLPSDAYDPSRESKGCWKPEQDGFPRPAVAYQHPIEPGESATLAYDVWAAPRQAADCIATKAYRFEPLYGAFTLTVAAKESEN